MKLDVSLVLIDVRGKPIMTSERFCPACRQTVGEENPLTFRDVLINVLEAKGPNEKIPFKTQMERYLLTVKLAKSDVVELDPGDPGMLQGLVSAIYGPAVTGPVGLLLEGEGD